MTDSLRTFPSSWATLAAMASATMLVGCGLEPTSTQIRPLDETAPWRLTLDHKAINLALTPDFDTLRLTATVRTASGVVLPGYPAPTIASDARDVVEVEPGGLLRALKANTRVRIIATLTVGRTTFKDTAMVRVHATAPAMPMASFSIQPLPGDSAKLAAASFRRLPVPRAQDANGGAINGLLFQHLNLDPDYLSITRNWWAVSSVSGLVMGYGRIAARTTAFGVQLADTLRYQVGLPLGNFIQVRKTVPIGSPTPVYDFVPAEIRIVTGGSIAWFNRTDLPADITFANPENVASITTAMFGCRAGEGDDLSGNVAPFHQIQDVNGSQCRERRFPVPGVYEFTSAAIPGATGRIVVENDAPREP